MPDIRIVPNSSSMSFTSSLNFIETLTQAPSGAIVLQGSGSTGRTELFSILGNNGQLFSVSDDLSNSLYSVNTIAGVPVLEVFSDYSVKMGPYGRQSLIITGSSGAVQLSGSISLMSLQTSSLTNVVVFNTSSKQISYNPAFTASYATQALSSSYALTASFALNAGPGGGSVSDFPYTGSAIISGSLILTGSMSISSSLFQYADNTDVDIGTEVVLSIETGSYRSAFFDYVISSGSNARAGTVMSVWGSASIDFTEASTNDIGTTTDVTLSTILSGSFVQLRATTLSNNWTVKSLVRML